MSKSLNRVKSALAAAGEAVHVLETPASTRTAAEAAAAPASAVVRPLQRRRHEL